MTRHDELVEEIAKKIWAIHAFPRGETDWDRAVEQAKRLIAATLKAVVDGMELPGEKWRQQYGPKEVIIALRPTGTEE